MKLTIISALVTFVWQCSATPLIRGGESVGAEDNLEEGLDGRDLQLSTLLRPPEVAQAFYDKFTTPRWGKFNLKIHMYDKMKEEKAFLFCFEKDANGQVDLSTRKKIDSRTFKVNESKGKYSDAHVFTVTKDNCDSGLWMVRYKAFIDNKWTILRPEEDLPRGFKTRKKDNFGIVEFLPNGMFNEYDTLCVSSHDLGSHWDSADALLEQLTEADEHYTLIYMNEPRCSRWIQRKKDEWIALNGIP